MKTPSCPERQQIVSLLSGQGDEASAEFLHLHLSTCVECQQALIDSCRNDSAIQSLKQEGTDGEYESELPLRTALRRLFEMGRSIGQQNTDSTVQLGGVAFKYSTYAGQSDFPATPQIEGYEILETLGRGGMGIVYKGRQAGLNRIVALKMILSGKHASQAEVTRFRAEAEAIARFHHPHIVQIHEIGMADGNPYFSMEYLDGGSLASSLRGAPQSPAEAAKLIQALADAVQYAHDNGVVHRDLKPANILMSQVNSSDDSNRTRATAGSVSHRNQIRDNRAHTCALGTPKIADFGLAKLLNVESNHTASGSILGSPSYMAPEQASGSLRNIGPASDTYSLGAILYEMLTGRPPFRAANVVETLDQVRSQEPLSPRQLLSTIPTDLETICLKCLQKDPAKRYVSAIQLAEDLQRFLAGEPILARPVDSFERAHRWIRRNPTVAGLIAAVVVVTLTGFTGIVWQWREAVAIAKVNQQLAYEFELKSQQERWERYRSSLHMVSNILDQPNNGVARNALATAPIEHRDWEWQYFFNHLDTAETVMEFGDADFHYCPVFDMDPKRWHLAMHAPDGKVEWWDPISSSAFQSFHAHTQRALRIVYSPDGSRVAVAANNHEIHVWNVGTGERLFQFQGHQNDVLDLVFNADGTRLASGGMDHNVRIWNTELNDQPRVHQNSSACNGLLFTPDGLRLIVASGKETKCVALASDEIEWRFTDQTDISCIAISPDGLRLARGSASPDFSISIWDLKSLQKLSVLTGHSNRVNKLQFSPDGKQLASSSNDKSIRIWDTSRGNSSMLLTGHNDAIFGLAYSRDGTRLVSGSIDGTGRIWDANSGDSLAVLRGHGLQVAQIAFSGDGKKIVTASFDGTIRIWDTQSAEAAVLRGQKKFVYDVTFLDNHHLASVGWDGGLRTWDLSTGKQEQMMEHAADVVASVACDARAQTITTLSRSADKDHLGRTITVWDRATGKRLQSIHLEKSSWIDSRCTMNPNGDQIAVGDIAGPVRIFDVSSGSELANVGEHVGGTTDVAYHPDGNQLASGGSDGAVRLWDLSKSLQTGELKGHKAEINRIAYSHDGTLLASASSDRTVRLWNPRNAQLIAELIHTSTVYGIAFSPDGNRLATGNGDKTIRLWDLQRFQEVAELRGHTDYVHAVAFSPDGLRLASASGDSTVRIWEATPVAK
jgi:eukaryotic-like serine/threonine-protein kinase